MAPQKPDTGGSPWAIPGVDSPESARLPEKTHQYLPYYQNYEYVI